MVILVPKNNNPTRNETDTYIYEMLASNSHNILNYTIKEITSKSSVGALLHPAEEYFINRFNQHLHSSSNSTHQQFEKQVACGPPTAGPTLQF